MANSRGQRVSMEGEVTEVCSPKTVRVEFVRKVKHGKYFKFYKVLDEMLAHDEKGLAKPGDRVIIVQDRARSCSKSWRLASLVTKEKSI